METLKIINGLIENWMTMMTVCNTRIKNGEDVEFWQRCKEQCTEGYHSANILLTKEMFKEIKSEETENGFYDREDNDRREDEREEIELYNQETI